MFVILRAVVSGSFAYLSILVFYTLFQNAFGMVMYHLNFAVFFLLGSFLEPSTIRMYVFGLIFALFAAALKKGRSLIN